jgi:aspartate carbamoyltransferase catalytic subunit
MIKVLMVDHVLSTKQFLDKKQLDSLFTSAANLQNMPSGDYPQLLKGRVVATLFYEPSTRTRLSFESAVLRLGGSVLSTENANQTSSAVKGESLEDSIRVVSGYADTIVLRHKEVGAAERASIVSDIPVINAGDGGGEHPTQALLDLYTIVQYKKQVDSLTIGLAGDLLNSRTLHSLIYMISIYKVELYLIAPKECQLPKQYLTYLDERNIQYHIVYDIEDCLDKLDVIYINRLQMERHTKAFIGKIPTLTKQNIKKLKPDAIILNPLPRVNEIEAAVDADPRAVYFQQAKNGVFIRMALLDLLLNPANK